MAYSKKTIRRHANAFDAAADRQLKLAEKEMKGPEDGVHNPDPWYAAVLRNDARRLRTIARRLRKGEIAYAKRLFWNTDSAVRDEVANSTYMWM